MCETKRCLLEAEAVILPGALTIADEVTAGGVKSQSRLGFDPAHIAVVPPVHYHIVPHFQLLLLTLVGAKLSPGRPGKASHRWSSLVTSFSLGV